MESCEAKHSGEGEEQKHRVEQDKPADGSIRILCIETNIRSRYIKFLVSNIPHKTIKVTSHIAGFESLNSLAVKYARGTHRAPKVALKTLIKV